MANPEERVTKRKLSFGATVKAVLWSFIGIRKRKDYEQDAAELNPIHVLIAGVIAAAIFVITLIVIVRIVIANA